MALAQNAPQQSRLPNMDPNFQRPSTGLARGVQITELKETRVNPEPVILEDSDMLLEQYISPKKLRLLTGVDDLEEVQSLEMKVDSTETSLGNFGFLLPNLTQLKLSGSVIPCVRDVGSSLRSLQVLWMSRCGLRELDGISSMTSLKEVYLSYNEILDISPISMIDTLQILDLEGNNIEEIVQVQYLALCPNLRTLALEGNPICVMPSPDSQELDYDYRKVVKDALPNLRILDEEPLLEGSSPNRKHNVFDEDWAYLEELQKDALLLHSSSEGFETEESEGSRPSTAALRPATAYRPGSTLCPSSAFRPRTSARRPATTSLARPGTALRPVTAANRPVSSDTVEIDATSELTMGNVICGNPSRALRERRKNNPSQNKDDEDKELLLFSQKSHKAEHTYDPIPGEERDMSEVIEELRVWRIEHEQRMEKIKESKAAQVLVIDHTEAQLTDTDSEDGDLDLGSRQGFMIPEAGESENTEFDKHNRGRVKPTGLKHDESFDADEIEDELVVCRHHRTPSPGRRVSVLRSQSPIPSTVISNGRQLPNPPPKNRMRTSPSFKTAVVTTATGLPMPVIRSVTSPPEKPMPPPVARPATSRAALALPSQPRIRRQLPEVPSLPPRSTFPKS